jgi:outer membrane lipoprotein LolB
MLKLNLRCFLKWRCFSRFPSLQLRTFQSSAFRLVVLIIASSVLTACLSRPVTDSFESMRKSVDGEYWRLKGRVAIKSAEQNGAFNLNWLQQGEAFDLRLSTSLGLSIAHMKGDQDKATINIPKQGSYEASSAAELLFNHTGFVIPLRSLRYWVRGNPSPKIEYERDGEVLKQSGWDITYEDFKEDLPVRMTLMRPEVRIILLVHDWQGT